MSRAIFYSRTWGERSAGQRPVARGNATPRKKWLVRAAVFAISLAYFFAISFAWSKYTETRTARALNGAYQAAIDAAVLDYVHRFDGPTTFELHQFFTVLARCQQSAHGKELPRYHRRLASAITEYSQCLLMNNVQTGPVLFGSAWTSYQYVVAYGKYLSAFQKAAPLELFDWRSPGSSST